MTPAASRVAASNRNSSIEDELYDAAPKVQKERAAPIKSSNEDEDEDLEFFKKLAS
jgi:hypothetical protein